MLHALVDLATVLGALIAIYGLTSHADTHLEEIRDLLIDIRDDLRH